MLRKIRIILQVIVMLSITILLLGVSSSVSAWIGWTAKIQFLPALMALNFVVLSVLIVLTLIFGRMYCSVVCPLGIMQDIFAAFGRKTKKNRYSYSPEKRWLRYSILAVFILCLIIGFAPVTTLLAPYSAYGRIINSLFKPMYDLLRNLFAGIESNYLFSDVEIWMRSITTTVVAALTLVAIGFLAWRNGRTYCNTICPVGTILSFFARFSVYKIRLDKQTCKNCSLCEKNCKAAAIDYKSGTVDYTRCVVCGDCLDKCKFDSLHYVKGKGQPVASMEVTTNLSEDSQVNNENTEPESPSRRAFLTGLAAVAGTAAIAETKMKVDGGLAVIEDKKQIARQRKVVPAGAGSLKDMTKRCTACQLCVSNCPNNVLRPDTDPMRLMQPVMSFERGYCRPECTRCSDVCPTGAIRPITIEDKTAIHIGHAVTIEANCLSASEGVNCNNCERHCPAGAITIVEKVNQDGSTIRVPVVATWLCIGCGACENLCPARPFPGIYVEGNEVHNVE